MWLGVQVLTDLRPISAKMQCLRFGVLQLARTRSVVRCRASAFSSASASGGSNGAATAQRLRGTSWSKKLGKWQAIITVSGERTVIGSFDDVQQAADAYSAAKAAVKQTRGKSGEPARQGGATPPVPSVECHPTYLGVLRERGVPLWEAVLRLDGEGSKEISGGEYESAEEAAKAYDALARMYVGTAAPTNFPLDTYEAWGELSLTAAPLRWPSFPRDAAHYLPLASSPSRGRRNHWPD